MTKSKWRWRPGKAAIVFGLAGMTVYFLMIFVTLTHLEALSGYVPFDMRPFGYGVTEATQILEGLEHEGRIYYLSRQIPLDTIYPALLAFTLISLIRWVQSWAISTKLAYAGVAMSIGAAAFDYAENLGVVMMILSWPDLPPALVRATSMASVTKSIFTTIAVVSVLVLGVIALIDRKRTDRTRPDSDVLEEERRPPHLSAHR